MKKKNNEKKWKKPVTCIKVSFTTTPPEDVELTTLFKTDLDLPKTYKASGLSLKKNIFFLSFWLLFTEERKKEKNKPWIYKFNCFINRCNRINRQ